MPIENDFLHIYRNADPKKKLDILLKNYSAVPRKIDFFQIKIRNDIKNEQEYLRGQRRGEIGVRVQTSKKSNPTEEEAISNLTLDEAFLTGEINRSVLNGIENASKYEADIKTVSVLKSDYELLSLIVDNLDETDGELLRLRYIEKKTLSVIGDKFEIHEDTVRKRLKIILEEIDGEILGSFELSSKILRTYDPGRGGRAG